MRRRQRQKIPASFKTGLQLIEDNVRAADKLANAESQTAIRYRWQSGWGLLRLRGGAHRLPNGALTELTGALTVHKSEIIARMKFAEKYPTNDELTNVISKFGTWFAIKQKALTNTPGPKKLKHPLSTIVKSIEKVDAATFDRYGLPVLTRQNLLLLGKAITTLIEKVDPATLDPDGVSLLRTRVNDALAQLKHRSRVESEAQEAREGAA